MDMMSEKQYKVARGGVKEQIKMAQRLHCPHMEAKYKQALEKLERRFLKPDKAGLLWVDGNLCTSTYYHI